jgi:hypothetical protein
MIAWIFFCLALAIFLGVKAGLAMKRKEKYKFGFLDGGLLLGGKETDPMWPMVMAGGLFIVAMWGVFVLVG